MSLPIIVWYFFFSVKKIDFEIILSVGGSIDFFLIKVICNGIK